MRTIVSGARRPCFRGRRRSGLLHPGLLRAALLGVLVVGLEGRALAAGGDPRRSETAQLVHDIVDGNGQARAVGRLHVLRTEEMATELLRNEYTGSGRLERERIAEAIAELGSPTLRTLIAELSRDDDAVVRQAAARALATCELRTPERLALFRSLLGDPTSGVRRQAAESLGRARLKSGGRMLAEVARGEGSPEVREAMLVSVGQAGDVAQARMLVPFLESSSESTRAAAARGLCLLGDKQGIRYAQRLLGSHDPAERRAGVLLFEGADAKVSGKVLRPMVDDADPKVAATAARVMAQAGDRFMVGWLVVKAERSHGQARLALEDEIERLQLTDAQRSAIRKQAGLR